MKFSNMTILIIISVVIVAGPAWSHFGMLIPSDSMVMQEDHRSVTVTVSFSHPFEMVGMDMGLNRFTLSSVVDEKGDLFYEGEGILPVCVSGRVDWLANTHVMTTDKIYEAVFEFKVAK